MEPLLPSDLPGFHQHISQQAIHSRGEISGAIAGEKKNIFNTFFLNSPLAPLRLPSTLVLTVKSLWEGGNRINSQGFEQEHIIIYMHDHRFTAPWNVLINLKWPDFQGLILKCVYDNLRQQAQFWICNILSRSVNVLQAVFCLILTEVRW